MSSSFAVSFSLSVRGREHAPHVSEEGYQSARPKNVTAVRVACQNGWLFSWRMGKLPSPGAVAGEERRARQVDERRNQREVKIRPPSGPLPGWNQGRETHTGRADRRRLDFFPGPAETRATRSSLQAQGDQQPAPRAAATTHLDVADTAAGSQQGYTPSLRDRLRLGPGLLGPPEKFTTLSPRQTRLCKASEQC